MTRKATPAQARAAALAIVRRLRDRGKVAYFAGGCVRDELLGLAPTDYDVATDARPAEIRAMFRRTAEVGAAFGVVLVTPGKDEGAEHPATVEVATFRSDGPYSDRRRPDAVEFGGPEQDARRRDFTVNALFLDPLAPGGEGGPTSGHTGETPPPVRGSVIDLVGGLDDLQGRLLRAVGDPEARLAEDHLRALRAVRLAARLGFIIDPATAAAIRAHTRDLKGVSRERIGDELRKMLGHGTRAGAVRVLEDLGLDAPVLEESPRRSNLEVLALLANHPDPEAGFPTWLSAWALDRDHSLTVTGPVARAGAMAVVQRWRRALCLSNAERDRLEGALLGLLAIRSEWETARVARQKRLAGGVEGGFGDAMRLLAVVDPGLAGRVKARIEALSRTPSGIAPEPLITGDDLVDLGFRPGPRFKVVLAGVYDAQLEDRVAKKPDAIALARELWEGRGV